MGPKRTLLIGVQLYKISQSATKDSLAELKSLADSLGYEIVDTKIYKRNELTPNFCIGKGQAEELQLLCKNTKIDLVLFDHELTPAQEKNLEKLLETKILNRTETILEIFAKRAFSKEGKLQVELAQNQYLLPRLTRLWTHLSRQSGAKGVRGGMGETQIEIDRRRIRSRIDKLKEEIIKIKTVRETQRKMRQRNSLLTVALIGYTNAGKSTLLNSLTDAHRLAADKLFSSLDSKAKKIFFPNTKMPIVFIDTVGFIKNLPHQLVESFKATLEEVSQADILLHVLDVSREGVNDRIKAVTDVLKELQVEDKPILTALNKIDLLTHQQEIDRWNEQIDNSISISAKDSTGFDKLFEKIKELSNQSGQIINLILPLTQINLLPLIEKQGKILSQTYEENHIALSAEISPKLFPKIQQFIASPPA